MGRDRLLVVAVVLIVAGILGVLLAHGLGLCRAMRGSDARFGGMMRMMDRRGGGMMGGGGMMDRDQMKEMMKRMMGPMLPPGLGPEELPDAGSPGATLVARFCGQCHDIPSPAMHTRDEWPRVESRMFARMSMMSDMPMMQGMGMESPSPDEQKEIVSYMISHAMKPPEPGALPEPGSAAALSFKTVCSQCHPLPDPKLHTAGEWPGVVERMRGHMKEMGTRWSRTPRRTRSSATCPGTPESRPPPKMKAGPWAYVLAALEKDIGKGKGRPAGKPCSRFIV